MKRNTLLASTLLAALAVVAMVGRTEASVAFTIDNTTGAGLGNPPFTLGFSFTANTPIVVTQLGLFDDSQDGLLEAHLLGLFDSVGNLLASTTVQSGTASPLQNQFRYESIAATPLPAGNYSVGGLYLTGNDGLIFPGYAANFATSPAITFNYSTYAPGGTLLAPSEIYNTDPAYFGPNFVFTAVPEPTTMIASALLLLPFGASALRVLRKKA